MMRHLSGWTVLLALAVAFVAALIWVRSQPPKVEDPLADAQNEVREQFGFEVDPVVGAKSGLLIQRVTPDTPAAQVGLRAGDRVVAVNERSVWQAVQLRDLLAEKMQKGPTFLLLEREGAYRQVVFGLPAHPRGSPQPASPGP